MWQNLIKFNNYNEDKVVLFKKDIIVFFLFFLTILGYLNFSSQDNNKKNIEDQTIDIEDNNILESLTDNLRSPYQVYKYVIKNNDSVQGILRKYGVNEDEISKIVKKLKDQKLSNIYSGREISIILKKNQNKKK